MCAYYQNAPWLAGRPRDNGGVEGLLLILAHPDDETWFAGTIAKYAAAGVEVTLVCATRGERGSTAGVCSIEELPRVREAEVRAAADILGIARLEMLPYEDQKLSSAAPDVIRRQLVDVIRATRPTAVVTFDPNGANQHTDHIAISRFTADAISCAADARWYPEAGGAHSVSRLLWWAPVLPRELARTAELAKRPGIDFVVDIAAFREKKAAAIRAHRTQYPGLRRLFFGDDGDETRMPPEVLRLGWGPSPRSRPSEDLFAM